MLRMFPDLWTWCYCFCFRWSVLRKQPGDCRWHSPSSSTWSKIIQKKKFIKVKEITEQISSERIEIDFSSIHQWVQLESIHPRGKIQLLDKRRRIFCVLSENVCGIIVTLAGGSPRLAGLTPANPCPSNCSQWCPSPLSQPLHRVLHNTGHTRAPHYPNTFYLHPKCY